MGEAVAVVGLGLSSIGTVAQISQQNKASRAQREALDAQALASEDRLRLAQAHFESTKSYSQQMRDREMQIIDAQTQQERQRMELERLQQDLQISSMQTQAKQIEAQANESANNILVNANQEAANLMVQSRNQLAQYAQELLKDKKTRADALSFFTAATQGNALTSGTQQANEEALLASLLDVFQTTQDDVATRNRSVDANTEYADTMAGYQRQLGQQTAEYYRSTADRQQQATDIGNVYNTKLLDLESQRNKIATDAAYKSSAASANMGYLSNMISERSQQASISAQRRATPNYGFLSFLNSASGILSQATPLFANPTQRQLSTPSWQQYQQPSKTIQQGVDVHTDNYPYYG
jgi:vacuolar-type H+-ATPase subunit H